MQKRIKALIMSFAAITVCLTLLSFGTYALFSDSVTVEHHLQAGSLDAKLERTNLESKVLGTDGYLETETNNNLVDFTSSTSLTSNVFDLEDKELVAPGTSYEATMKLSNNGTVAFSYWIAISFKDKNASDLASQLKVYVTTYDEDGDEVVKEAYIKDGLLVGSETAPLGELAKGASVNFKVKVVFEDLINNNAAQNDEVNFDLAVYAVQVLEK